MLEIINKTAIFAHDHIASRNDLYTLEEFPFDIWEKMRKEGLLGQDLTIQKSSIEKTGLSLIFSISRTLIKNGHNVGIALSWLIHQLVLKFCLMQHGSKELKILYGDNLKYGKITTCFAVSEPNIGAHPKYLQTTAVKTGDNYILNGEKAYVTNAPIADIFIVIACTDKINGKKKYTAFAVPADIKGVIRQEQRKLPFLSPYPHGGIILKNCEIPTSFVIGEHNLAWEKIVVPFGKFEEILLSGIIIGGMECQLQLMQNFLFPPTCSMSDKLLKNIEKLINIINTAEILLNKTIKKAEEKQVNWQGDTAFFHFNNYFKHFQEELKKILSEYYLDGHSEIYDNISIDDSTSINSISSADKYKKFNLITKDLTFLIKLGNKRKRS